MKAFRICTVMPFVVACLTFFFALGGSGAADSKEAQATLMLSPGTASYRAGESFNVDIFVGTGTGNVVGVAAYVKYDPNRLSANSIDTTDSIFPKEAENTIDATRGLIKVSRGATTPGVNIDKGKVASINFTVLPLYQARV